MAPESCDDRRLSELALFAGAGGGILASRLLGWRTICAVEIDPYCREILLRRQEEGHLEAFPIWDDVRSFDGKPWRGSVEVISAGFPCQPFSVAGKRAGKDDSRNMWPETIRVIREVGPQYCLLENVPGLLAHEYFGTILGELAESGYDARWRVLSAAELGAPHKRDRLWIVAHAACDAGKLQQGQRKDIRDQPTKHGSTRVAMADASELRRRQGRQSETGTERRPSGGGACEVPDSPSMQRQAIERSEQDGVLSEVLADARRAPTRCKCNSGTTDAAQRGEGTTDSERRRKAVYDALRGRHGTPEGQVQAGRDGTEHEGWWSVEPDVGRVADGVAYRVDRLRALGNGQVPAVVRAAWDLLNGE